MKNPSLSRRLWLPSLTIGIVFLAMAATVAVRTHSQVASTRAAQLEQLSNIEQATRWTGLTEVNAARSLAALQSADASLADRLKEEMAGTSTKISEIQKSIEARIGESAGKATLTRIATARQNYVDQRRQALDSRSASGAVPEPQLQAVRAGLAAYLDALRSFVAEENRRAEALADDMARQRLTTVYTVAAVLLALVALLMTSTALTARAIVQPLRQAREATDRIAGGDLTVRLDNTRGDEIGELMRGLDRMTAALRRLVGEVRSGASSMQVASAEIATGNNDLSSRTEQTASDLQATAGSMSQLTTTVQQSADAAAQANQLASSAADAATRGGEVVNQVVTNMDEIATSSRKIGDIIGVIDGIAFQTNILALNAAVEAARAGEQGRGFAVVAGEVRALAQRSAGAAREIKSLIGASMSTVEHGSKLVQDAGSTMTELVSSVRRVTDIIGEISASAREQNDGIRQVNQAVTRLDEMTQQNAALVEESAAAASSLREQAQRLNQLVGQFEVGHDTGLSGSSPTVAAPAQPKAHHAAAPVHSRASTAPAPQAPATAAPKRASANAPAPSMPATAAPAGAGTSAGTSAGPAAAAPSTAAAVTVGDDWETF